MITQIKVDRFIKLVGALIENEEVTEWKKDYFLCTRLSNLIGTLRRFGISIKTEYKKTKNNAIYASWVIERSPQNLKSVGCFKMFLLAFSKLVELEKEIIKARCYSAKYRDDKNLMFVLLEIQKIGAYYRGIYDALQEQSLHLQRDFKLFSELGNNEELNKIQKQYSKAFDVLNEFKNKGGRYA